MWRCLVICETVTEGTGRRHQTIDVKGTTVLHPNVFRLVTALIFVSGEADDPFYFSLIHYGMIVTQPAWICRTACVTMWTLSRHSYS